MTNNHPLIERVKDILKEAEESPVLVKHREQICGFCAYFTVDISNCVTVLLRDGNNPKLRGIYHIHSTEIPREQWKNSFRVLMDEFYKFQSSAAREFLPRYALIGGEFEGNLQSTVDIECRKYGMPKVEIPQTKDTYKDVILLPNRQMGMLEYHARSDGGADKRIVMMREAGTFRLHNF